jgi:hypothetical protein
VREVFSFLNRVLAGCGVESEVQEAAGIIASVIEGYGRGDITEEELSAVAVDVCTALANLAARCGRSYPVDVCRDDLVGLVKTSAGARGLRARLAKRKRPSEVGGVRLI